MIIIVSQYRIVMKLFIICSIILKTVLLTAQTGVHTDDSFKTDNPYIAVIIIFLISLSIPIALINNMQLARKGQAAAGIIFGLINWLITVPICISAQLNTASSLALATLSSGMIIMLVIRYGSTMASWFGKH
jgi:hypothetical protein